MDKNEVFVIGENGSFMYNTSHDLLYEENAL